jgi:hypothetical protein
MIEETRRTAQQAIDSVAMKTPEPYRYLKKVAAPAWDREPREGAFRCQCRFHTEAWGHPSSFPLRGRWERSVKSDEQAPSPSLTVLHISSCKTRHLTLLMQKKSHLDAFRPKRKLPLICKFLFLAMQKQFQF